MIVKVTHAQLQIKAKRGAILTQKPQFIHESALFAESQIIADVEVEIYHTAVQNEIYP